MSIQSRVYRADYSLFGEEYNKTHCESQEKTVEYIVFS